MEVHRTVPVKLNVPDERRDDLHETVEQFLHSANRGNDFAWHNTHRDECVTSKATAERAKRCADCPPARVFPMTSEVG